MHRAQAAEAVDTAIVFIQDTSSSMDVEELAMARESYLTALTSYNVLHGITEAPRGRVAAVYVEFGASASVVVPWTIIDGPETALAFARAIAETDAKTGVGSTNIQDAMTLANALLSAVPYEADRMVVDIVGDGPSDRPPILERAALIAKGATINGLPMLIRPDRVDLAAYFRDEVIGGPSAFVLTVDSIQQLPVALFRKVSRELF